MKVFQALCPHHLSAFFYFLLCLYICIHIVVGLDIQDEMGRHEVGHIENSMKVPLNNGHGCRFQGEFSINKVRDAWHQLHSFLFVGSWMSLVELLIISLEAIRSVVSVLEDSHANWRKKHFCLQMKSLLLSERRLYYLLSLPVWWWCWLGLLSVGSRKLSCVNT